MFQVKNSSTKNIYHSSFSSKKCELKLIEWVLIILIFFIQIKRLTHVTDSIWLTSHFEDGGFNILTWLWVWQTKVKYHNTNVPNLEMLLNLLNLLLKSAVSLDKSPSLSSPACYASSHSFIGYTKVSKS